MNDNAAVPQDQKSEIKSGPEIVEAFMNELSGSTDLDESTVSAILALYASEKLNPSNLQKQLEMLRTGARR